MFNCDRSDSAEEVVKLTKEKIDLNLVLSVVLSIFLLIILVELYFSLNSLIAEWVNYRYMPAYSTLLNVALLAIIVYFLNWLRKSQ